MVEQLPPGGEGGGRLAHPNIVTAYDAEHSGDADQIGDTHFLVMEYVEGVSPARLLAEHGRLPVTQACDCVRQAARACSTLSRRAWSTATSSRRT
jgi:serine/threonine-protein kinase